MPTFVVDDFMHAFITSLGDRRKKALNLCCQSIRLQDPKTKIICFGDSITGSGPYRLESFYEFGSSAFDFWLDYHYNGPNHFAREWTSIARWFVYLEYCKKHKIREFFTCDSDMLIFAGPDEILARNIDSGWVAGFSLFHNLQPLEEFCDWVPKALRSTLQDPGNWIDMGLWQDFYVHHTKTTVRFLGLPEGGTVVDPNLSLVEGWERNGEGKKVYFDGSGPHGVYGGQKVKFLALHFWGPFLERMQEFWGEYIKTRPIKKGWA